MDIKSNLALKKKRELLGATSKRKMSLRNNIDCLKQNECTLDITQVTKCVFLGSLCLKPVPQLFDSPLLLKELDMKVGSISRDDVIINNENINGVGHPTNSLKQHSMKASTKKQTKQKYQSLQKSNKRSLRERNDIKVVSNGANKLDNESGCVDSEALLRMNGASSTIRNMNDEVVNVPSTNDSQKSRSNSPEIVTVSPVTTMTKEVVTEAIEDSTFSDDDVEIPNFKIYPKKRLNKVSDIPNELPNDDSTQPTNKSISSSPYEDIERLEREPTPEIILSDSDEDAIDQLMYNIMDIKVDVDEFEKNFFGIAASVNEELKFADPVDEELEEEYSKEANEEKDQTSDKDDSASSVKKYEKRNPKCKICSKVFSSYMQIKKHKAQSHGGDKPYVCLKCNDRHKTLDQLLAHLRVHQGKRPYVCHKCNEGFRTMKALEKHKPVHILKKTVYDKKPYQCEVCAKEFRKLCDLERHTRVHTGEKPSVCNICNKRFQQAHNLNKHLLIHTKEKPFECDICNKKFGRNDVLNRHLLTHYVKKPNQCEICRKSFIRISQLLAHKEKYHGQKAS